MLGAGREVGEVGDCMGVGRPPSDILRGGRGFEVLECEERVFIEENGGKVSGEVGGVVIDVDKVSVLIYSTMSRHCCLYTRAYHVGQPWFDVFSSLCWRRPIVRGVSRRCR